MKAISQVLGFLSYWMYGIDEEERSIKTILRLD